VLESRTSPSEGEVSAETQDGVRTSFSGRPVTARRWGGRGAGAVKATGSYEGSLSVEDTSGRHEPSPFTRRWSRRPWRLPHAEERRGSHEPKLEGDAKATPTLRGRGRGDRGVRGSIRPLAPWEENAHARSSRRRRKTTARSAGARWQARDQWRSAEAFSSAVKHSVPRKTARSPRLRGVSTRRKSRSEPGTHEVRVHVNRSGGRSRSDASRVLLSGRSQGLLENQGASQKEARSTA
jgi:hypothetical protein